MPWIAAATAGGAGLGYLSSKQDDGGEYKIPFKGAINPYKDEVKGFGDAYNPQFFEGQTFVDPSAYTQSGINQLGNFNVDPSMDYYQQVMGGGMLSPEFQNAVMEPAMENTASRFAAANRYGSPVSQQMTAESGMRALAPYWNDQQGRGMQAAGAIPQLQDFQARQNLAGGGLQEQYGQQQIDEDMQRWNFNQQQPLNRMQGWGSLYGPLTGAGGYQTQGGGSPLAGALGGGMLGMSIADQFGWGSSNPATSAAGSGYSGGYGAASLGAPANFNTPGMWGNLSP